MGQGTGKGYKITTRAPGATPRERRNAAAMQEIDLLVDSTLKVDRNGLLGVAGADPVDTLESDASLSDVIAKVNELIMSLKGSGGIRK